MEFLRHVVRGVLHPHVRTQQGVVHAAFQRQSVGELLAHGDAEAQRLVVAERTLAVSAAAQGRQAVAVADHRRSIIRYRSVEHPGSQTFAVRPPRRRRQTGRTTPFYAVWCRLRTARRRTPHDRPRRPPTALRAARKPASKPFRRKSPQYLRRPPLRLHRMTPSRLHRTTPSPPLRKLPPPRPLRPGPQAHRPSGDLSGPPSAQAALRPQRGATAAPRRTPPRQPAPGAAPPPLQGRPVRFPAPRAAVSQSRSSPRSSAKG